MSRLHSAAGFSLIEVLAATLIMLTLMTTMMASYRFHLFALRRQETQLDVQETARGLIDLATREVRQAGYDPTCSGAFEGIADARPARLRVQFDRNGDGAISADENITYEHDVELHEISRTAGTNRVPLVSEVPNGMLTFIYFDGGGVILNPTGNPPALTPAQRAAVRRIRIAVHMERPGPDPLGPQPVVSNLMANIDLRNRFFNAGVGCP